MADRRRGWRRREVTRRTNAIRRQHGLRPLRASARLSAAARFHAADMSRRDYFDHNTPAGAVAGGRGLPAMSWVTRLLRFDRHPAGENIAWGQDDPAEVVAAWMASPEHRANILRPGFRRIGVGWHAGQQLWVQDFGY